MARKPEREFQDAVVEYARLQGWRVAHFTPAFARKGKFLTHGAYDSAGFPDLCLVRDRIVFMECKRKGVLKLREEQIVWFETLRHAGIECYVVNPGKWALVEQVLR